MFLPMAIFSIFNSMYSGNLDIKPLTFNLRNLIVNFPPALTPSDVPIVLIGNCKVTGFSELTNKKSACINLSFNL